MKKLTVFAKYLDLVNILLKKSVLEIFKYSKINLYAINLKKDKYLL